jgi:hypothetical protein
MTDVQDTDLAIRRWTVIACCDIYTKFHDQQSVGIRIQRERTFPIMNQIIVKV